MRWHILGAGAIGCLFARDLLTAGLRVCLILREQKSLDQLHEQHNAILVRTEAGDKTCQVEAQLPDADDTIEHLLVTTKAYDTVAAVRRVAHRLKPGAHIVLLQNGYGQQQAVAEAFPNFPIWAASTTRGAHKTAPFTLVPAGEGVTRIGPMQESDVPNDVHYPAGWDRLNSVEYHYNIHQVLLQKLAINAAINPLTALYNCRNSELLSNPDLNDLLAALCEEIEHILIEAKPAHLSLPLFDHPLFEVATKVATDTGANYSSMQQDIRYKRPTEIEEITGYLCALAEQHNIEAPLNQQLLTRVRELSKQAH